MCVRIVHVRQERSGEVLLGPSGPIVAGRPSRKPTGLALARRRAAAGGARKGSAAGCPVNGVRRGAGGAGCNDTDGLCGEGRAAGPGPARVAGVTGSEERAAPRARAPASRGLRAGPVARWFAAATGAGASRPRHGASGGARARAARALAADSEGRPAGAASEPVGRCAPRRGPGRRLPRAAAAPKRRPRVGGTGRGRCRGRAPRLKLVRCGGRCAAVDSKAQGGQRGQMGGWPMGLKAQHKRGGREENQSSKSANARPSGRERAAAPAPAGLATGPVP